MYNNYYINSIKEKIQDIEMSLIYKNKVTNFTRNRKMNFEKVVLYGLNKRGLTSKMKNRRI